MDGYPGRKFVRISKWMDCKIHTKLLLLFLSIVWSRSFRSSFHSSVNAMVVCKTLRKHVGLLGFIMKLRNKHTRNSPDVLHREFFRYSRIVNSGTCSKVPDKIILSFDTWHFVEGGGRLFKLFSNEFAAWSD